MVGYVVNLEKRTIGNSKFREVLHTTSRSQLVVMSLKPGEDIGMEVHDDVDQFLRIETGEGKAILDGKEYSLRDGTAVVVPSGVKHNFINTSTDKDLRLYTIYTPPEHPEGTVHATKAEAEAAGH
jgi:mannose-6-phosphate isomerase-like protein (cupin superfamily)